MAVASPATTSSLFVVGSTETARPLLGAESTFRTKTVVVSCTFVVAIVVVTAVVIATVVLGVSSESFLKRSTSGACVDVSGGREAVGSRVICLDGLT